MKMNSRFVGRLAFISVVVMILARLVNACTRISWNTNPGLLIVGRNEDFVTASRPTLVVTPHGVKRWGTADSQKKSRSATWMVKYAYGA